MGQIDILSVENISSVRDRQIFKNISFEIRLGEMLILLGPSGSGKTSILRCLNRLDPMESGRILLQGEDINYLPVEDLRRRVGLVFQIPALAPTTAWENVAIGPKLAGNETKEEELKEL